MGVAEHKFNRGMIESALSRAGGVNLDNYQYGPETNPNPTAGFRNYKNKKKGTGVGHTYLHVQGPSDAGGVSGRADKSRFADTDTLLGTLVEVFGVENGVVQKALQSLDAKPGSQEWLKVIAITGAWYGYGANSNDKKKITSISVNLRSHGDALFISSAYPDGLTAIPVAHTSKLNPSAKAFVPGGG